MNTQKTALATMFALMFSTAHAAEENQDKDKKDVSGIEVIEVTSGIKYSIVKAQSIKLNADSIVDAITAEDIGKFTDSNLAESLQRIPGVQISRSENGEGQYVSIRGLGPQFVRTTVNGRSMSGGSGGDNGLGNQRAYGLDGVSPDMTSGVVVMKTQTASVEEGGIGGVVDIKTIRPLDFLAGEKEDDGFFFGANIDAFYNAESEETDPSISLTGAWRITDTFGVFANVINSERSTLTQISRDRGYKVHEIDGQEIFGPSSGVQYSMNDGSLTRESYNLTLQWQPSDDLDITADYMNSSWLTERRQNVLISDISGIEPTNSVIDTSNAVGVDGYLREADFMGPTVGQISPNETVFDREENLYGMHINWNPDAGPLTIDFDVAYSDSGYDRNEYLLEGVAVNEAAGIHYDATGDAQLFSMYDANGNTLDVENMTFSRPGSVGYNMIDYASEETAYRLDVEYELDNDFISSVKVGGSIRELESSLTFNLQRYGTDRQDALLAEHGLTEADLPSYTSFLAPEASGGFLSELGSVAPDTWNNIGAAQGFDFWNPLVENSACIQGQGGLDIGLAATGDCSGFNFFSEIFYYNVEEKISSVYAQANILTEIAGMTLTGNVGVRYVQTDVTGTGYVDSELRTAKGDYSNVLPSLNLSLGITDNTYVRFAASTTVARPEPDQLAGAGGENPTIDPITDEITGLSVTRKNPDLEPYTANQYDVIVEWYPGSEGMFFAAGYFYKDISDFNSTDVVFPDEYTYDGVTYSSTDIDISIAQPVNSGDAKVSGIELQGHIPFSEFIKEGFFSHMGVQASYTHLMDNETPADDPITGAALPFPGASEDNYSAVAYYDDGTVSSRLSYTYREQNYLAVDYFGAATFAEDFTALDFNISYQLNDNLSFRFQANNLLEEPIRKSVANGNMPSFYSQNGKSYNVGVRVTF
ncbi:TonB-dependent receptor [Colwellia demingiae]|nr:TonB-dependent receptor [Colwellia demingiae]